MAGKTDLDTQAPLLSSEVPSDRQGLCLGCTGQRPWWRVKYLTKLANKGYLFVFGKDIGANGFLHHCPRY